MRIVLLVVLTLVPAATVAAQESSGGATTVRVQPLRQALLDQTPLEGAPLERAPLDRALLVAATPAQGAQGAQPPAPPPPPPPPPSRRRGSFVGYIDDAIVESKVRARFDLARHNTVPDRAEFFYAKCGCYSDPSLPAAVFDPDAPGPRPGAAVDVNYQQLNVWGEYAFAGAISVFGQVPVRWLQPQAFAGNASGYPDQSGIGDVRGGVKFGVNATDARSLTAQAQFFFPTGDAGKGLGVDHASIEPAILYHQRLADALAIESQLGITLPFDGSAPAPNDGDGKFSGRVLTYGIGSGYELVRRGGLLAGPVVELVGWRVLSGYQTVNGAPSEADGTNIVNLKVGGRVTLNGQSSLYVGYGWALTDQTWYDDILRFEYRFVFP